MKTITVNQLHKMLGKLIADGAGRRPVCVDKSSFRHNCEADGVAIFDVHSCEPKSVLWWNNDTDDCLNKDGTERHKKVVVLAGNAKEEK